MAGGLTLSLLQAVRRIAIDLRVIVVGSLQIQVSVYSTHIYHQTLYLFTMYPYLSHYVFGRETDFSRLSNGRRCLCPPAWHRLRRRPRFGAAGRFGGDLCENLGIAIDGTGSKHLLPQAGYLNALG